MTLFSVYEYHSDRQNYPKKKWSELALAIKICNAPHLEGIWSFACVCCLSIIIGNEKRDVPIGLLCIVSDYL